MKWNSNRGCSQISLKKCFVSITSFLDSVCPQTIVNVCISSHNYNFVYRSLYSQIKMSLLHWIKQSPQRSRSRDMISKICCSQFTHTKALGFAE